MKKILRYLLLFLVFVFVVIQFINRPEKINEPVTENDMIAILNVDSEMGSMIKGACYDCHSNQPRYPWYANVAPVSWWLAQHIEEGQDELNFSEWGTYSARKRDHKMEEIAEQVEKREMPLPNYVSMHSEAKLSEEQIEALKNWVAIQRNKIAEEGQ